MLRDQILIVTRIDDPHTDDMVLALERIGHEPVRLNTDDIPANTRLELNCGDGNGALAGTIEILTNGRSVDLARVRSIWWRRPSYFGLVEDLTIQEQQFASKEIEHALRSIWASMDCYWISHPDKIRQASWKAEQLLRAESLGFKVPRTLITTDPDKAKAFLESCGGEMIFKVMSDPFLASEDVAYHFPDESRQPVEAQTTLITTSQLDILDSVRSVPCLFQEYVPKAVELRITVIGDELFAAEIHSQNDERTAVDWRRFDVDLPYFEGKLPHNVASRCMNLVKSYDLNFSALDLIRTPEGEYVFLENNPNGQFIFIEDKLPQFAMIDTLATCLARGSNS